MGISTTEKELLETIQKETATSIVEATKDLAKLEDLNDLVKADEIAKLTKSIEDLKATLKQAGDDIAEIQAKASVAVNGSTNQEDDDEFKTVSGDKTSEVWKSELNLPLLVTKATTDTNAVVGKPVNQIRPYFDLEQGSLARMLSMSVPVSGGSFKLPKFGSGTADKNDDAGSLGEAGTVTSTTVIANFYSQTSKIAEPDVDDIAGLDSLVVMEHVSRIAAAEGQDFMDALEGATLTGVNSGVSGGVPTDFTKYIDLASTLPSQYWSGAAWILSRQAWANSVALAAALGTGAIVSPGVNGGMHWTMLGSPVYVCEYLGTADVAVDETIAFFGDFMRGSVLGTSKNFTSNRTLDNSLGHVTYYSRARSKSAIWEDNAIVELNATA